MNTQETIAVQPADVETLDVELAEPLTRKGYKIYRGNWRILNAIHKQTAPILNAMRQARAQQFRGEDDKFIPDYAENLLDIGEAVRLNSARLV